MTSDTASPPGTIGVDGANLASEHSHTNFDFDLDYDEFRISEGDSGVGKPLSWVDFMFDR